MPIDPSTVRHFNTLTRDNLRDMARANNVRGRTRYGNVSVPFSSATKDELIAGFDHERNNNGRFAYQSTTSASDGNPAASNGNLTVKAQNVILFLQGKGCGKSGTNYIGAEAFKDGQVRLANCETEAPGDVDDLEVYDNFWTTLHDLRDLVAALETYSND